MGRIRNYGEPDNHKNDCRNFVQLLEGAAAAAAAMLGGRKEEGRGWRHRPPITCGGNLEAAPLAGKGKEGNAWCVGDLTRTHNNASLLAPVNWLEGKRGMWIKNEQHFGRSDELIKIYRDRTENSLLSYYQNCCCVNLFFGWLDSKRTEKSIIKLFKAVHLPNIYFFKCQKSKEQISVFGQI